MIKKTSQLLIIIFIITIFNLGLVNNDKSITHAQSDGLIERVDDVMRHLSRRLSRPISRETHEWQFSEGHWTNRTLGCGVSDDTHSTDSIAGYSIRIVVNDVVYNYYVNNDGSILISCSNGVPDGSSIGIEIRHLEKPDVIVQTLPAESDWVWTHGTWNDTINLSNPNGLQVQIPRPQMPNEIPYDGRDYYFQFKFSPDNRYLILTAPLANDRFGVGFYSLETNEFIKIHHTISEVQLGASFAISDADGNIEGQQIAMGFIDWDPTIGDTWRVIIFDVASGNVVSQLDSTNSRTISVISSLPRRSYFPIPSRYDELDGAPKLHIVLVPWWTEGTPNPPAIIWDLTNDEVAIRVDNNPQ